MADVAVRPHETFTLLAAAWFSAGLLVAGIVFIALSVPVRLRSPHCHRPLVRPVHAGARVLAASSLFQAMAESMGPFGEVAGHQRSGCADEYWVTPAHDTGRAVTFSVSHGRNGAAPAIRAVLGDLTVPRTGGMVRLPRGLPETAPNGSERDLVIHGGSGPTSRRNHS